MPGYDDGIAASGALGDKSPRCIDRRPSAELDVIFETEGIGHEGGAAEAVEPVDPVVMDVDPLLQPVGGEEEPVGVHRFMKVDEIIVIEVHADAEPHVSQVRFNGDKACIARHRPEIVEVKEMDLPVGCQELPPGPYEVLGIVQGSCDGVLFGEAVGQVAEVLPAKIREGMEAHHPGRARPDFQSCRDEARYIP